jgi:signal transduction histidine kinase
MNPPKYISRDARILIVDDDEPSAAALARVLDQAGYQACTAITCPIEAVARFSELKPDLVLLDLHMEPLSGIDVLKRINEVTEARSRPPVLMLTADTTMEAKHEALAAGAADFLAKPVDSVEVILRIENHLTSRDLFQRCQLYSEGLERLVDKRTVELQQKTAGLEKAITELRDTQHQIIQQERMHALGTMASGIAHDLNNGLSIILGYGDMLLSDVNQFPTGSNARRELENIVLAGYDNAELVKRLGEFYRPRDTREARRAIDLNDVIEEALALTTPRWESQANAGGATIRIKKDLGEISKIGGMPTELREVMTNLIFNAVDAMPQGGRLCFRTREKRGQVRVQICDSGTGMNEQTRRKCMEPFFTTKGKQGSGLGLAMSHGIIRRHGGCVDIESELGKGTTFSVYLPVLKNELQPTLAYAEGIIGKLRVLVVDDQPAILEIVRAYLEEDQHIVATALDGREAMQKFCTERFDLIITDRAMPEMNGDELAASIKQLEPLEPIIMLTGFADLIIDSDQCSKNVDLVLSKPARLDDLRKAIMTVMPDRSVVAA